MSSGINNKKVRTKPNETKREPTMAIRRRSVCLFGLSGDPPTGEGGHVGIARALSKLTEFDQIRILPVYRHNFAVRTIMLEMNQRERTVVDYANQFCGGNGDLLLTFSYVLSLSLSLSLSRILLRSH